MKKSIGYAIMALSLFACGSRNGKTETFKVWGNCGMCEETIEGSLKTDGVLKANWDKDSKIMEVTYDTSKITLDQIHERIAESGYDTEKLKGSDSAYAHLNECCQYERKKN